MSDATWCDETNATYRQDGGRVYFDNNYRRRQWPDIDEARAAYEAVYRLTDIALPTADDEKELFGDDSNDAIIERLRSWGVSEIVLKVGSEGSHVADESTVTHVPPQHWWSSTAARLFRARRCRNFLEFAVPCGFAVAFAHG